MLPRHYWGWVGAQFLSWQCSFRSSLSPSAVVQLLDRPNSCCWGVHLQQLVWDPACGLGAVLATPFGESSLWDQTVKIWIYWAEVLVFPACPKHPGKQAWDKTKKALQETIPLCMQTGHGTSMGKSLQWNESPAAVHQLQVGFFPYSLPFTAIYWLWLNGFFVGPGVNTFGELYSLKSYKFWQGTLREGFGDELTEKHNTCGIISSDHNRKEIMDKEMRI